MTTFVSSSELTEFEEEEEGEGEEVDVLPLLLSVFSCSSSTVKLEDVEDDNDCDEENDMMSSDSDSPLSLAGLEEETCTSLSSLDEDPRHCLCCALADLRLFSWTLSLFVADGDDEWPRSSNKRFLLLIAGIIL